MHLFQKFLKKLKLPKAFSNRKNENRFEITTGGAFQNAHHFTISEANMYDISQATDPGREGGVFISLFSYLLSIPCSPEPSYGERDDCGNA
jgi:hypothetical protein